MKVFTYIIIIIVAVAIVAGFFIVGSPTEERLRRFDENKINDLQLIQGEIITYWQNKERLPASLEELNDSIRGFVAPKDPQTGEAYRYQILQALSFELCANFNLASRGSSGENAYISTPEPSVAKRPVPYDQSQNWTHETGTTCFKRTIDPEIYRPAKLD